MEKSYIYPMLLCDKNNKVKGCLMGILLLFSLVGKAQNTPYYINYTTEDGLPSNTIYELTRDSNGMMWFATANGVSSFDGFTFTNYDLSAKGLSNQVYTIFCDHLNRIWFSDINGTLGFIQEREIYSNKQRSFIPQLTSSYIVAQSLPEHDLTVLISNNKVYSITSDDVQLKLEKDSLTSPHAYYDYFSIKQNKTKDLEIETSTGLFQLNIKSWELRRLSSKRTYNGIFRSPKVVFRSDLNIRVPWFSTEKKQFRLLHNQRDTIVTINSGKPSYQAYMVNANGLNAAFDHSLVNIDRAGEITQIDLDSGYQINWLDEDNHHNLWCATMGQGVLFIPINYLQINRRSIQRNLAHLNVLGLKGQSVLTYGRSNSCRLIDSAGERGYPILVESALKNLYINRVRRSNNDLLFSKNQGISEVPAERLQMPIQSWGGPNIIDAFKKGRRLLGLASHSIWFSDSSGQDPFTQIFIEDIGFCTQLCKDSSENLLAIGSKGVVHIDLQHKRIKKVSSVELIQMEVNPEGELYGLTSSGKLVHINTLVDSLKITSLEQGIDLGPITKFIEYKNRFFCKCNDGLVVLKWDNDHLVYDNGLLNTSARKLIDFDIYEGDMHLFYKEQVLTMPILRMPERLDVRLQVLPKSSHISIRPYERYVQINIDKSSSDADFLVFSAAHNLRDVSYTIGDRTNREKAVNGLISLRDVKAGNQPLTIYAKDNLGHDLPVMNCVLINRVPLTEHHYTPWIAGLITLFIISFLVIRNLYIRNKSEQELSSFQEEVTQSRIRALQAQINPHFTFNALNTFQVLVKENKKAKALSYLQAFSNLLRDVLTTATEEFIPIQKEIEVLKQYLDIERLRLPEATKCDIMVGDGINADKVMIPPMLTQPILENALWHGVGHQQEGLVTVFYELKDDSLLVTVQDNGRGYEPTKNPRTRRKSIGTKNVESRLTNLGKLYQVETSLTIENISNGDDTGTKVIMRLPKITS